MDAFDRLKVLEQVIKIINKVPNYNRFWNSSKIKEESAKALTDYLINNKHVLENGELKDCEMLIKEWIHQDLMRLESLNLQDGSRRTTFKTKKKKNNIETRIITFILAGAIVAGLITAAKGDKPHRPQPTLPPIGVSDPADAIRKAAKEPTNDDYLERLLANPEPMGGEWDTYGNPEDRITGDFTRMDYMMLFDFNRYYEMGEEYAQISLYNFYKEFVATNGREDAERVMDVVFGRLKDKLKRYDPSGEQSPEYLAISSYDSYLTYVSAMLKKAGYDVSMYDDSIRMYEDGKKDYFYCPYHNILPLDIKSIREMLGSYDEYMGALIERYDSDRGARNGRS